MAYTLGNWYYFEAFGGNSGLFLNREGSGALQNHQNISIYRNTTGTADNPDHQFRLEPAYHNGAIEGCSIRSLLNEAYGLNIYGYGSDMTAEANCNLAIVGGTTSAASNYNDTLIDLLTVDGDQMLYRIKLIKHPGLFLTATSNSNNADVRWMRESGGSNQLWKLRTSETGSSGGTTNRLQYPVQYSYISNYFSNTHSGVDFVCPGGTPVHAAAAGKIIYTKTWTASEGTASWASMGNVIYVQHNGSPNLLTVYMHLREIDTELAYAGKEVSAGEIIAYSGNTGRVKGETGYHLHFTVVEKNGDFTEEKPDAYNEGIKIDPLKYLA